MSGQLKKELRQVLPDTTQIFIMYGATEASARLTCLDPDQFDKKMGSIGKPIPGVSLKILTPNGSEVSQGETGELVAAGSNIMQGYWKDPATSQKVLDGNGYHTGDLSHQDEDGFYYIKGRKDNLLKVGGHRINPQEIEDVIMESGLAIEAAVVGMPDALLGQKMVAMITPKDEELDENILLASCESKLPRYKIPSEIRFVKSLPKNISGKINLDQIIEILKNNTNPHR